MQTTATPGIEMIEPPRQLTEQAEHVLDGYELYSVPHPYREDVADIHSTDGDFLFTVSKTIGQHDLAAIISYGNKQYDRGVDNGRQAMRAALRDLIGAAPLEPTE